MIQEKPLTQLIEVRHADTIRRMLGSPTAEICDHSIGSIFMWRETLDTKLIFDGAFCLAEHYEGRTYFALRAADPDFLLRVRNLYRTFGAPLYLCSLTETELELLKAEFGSRFSCSGEDGAADYIYDAEALRSFSGKKYHSQKNHLNAFLRSYPDYSFTAYNVQDQDAIADFFNEYEESAADSTESAKKETLACLRLLPMLGDLPLDARILRIGEKIAGFVVMEQIGDTLMIHIEKGLVQFRGIYPMLVRLEALAYPEVRYINREEDDGNEGLRRSKRSYHPIFLKQKYLGCIL